MVTATILLPLTIITAFCFGGSPVPSISVDPINTNIVLLVVVFRGIDDLLLGVEQKIMSLDAQYEDGCKENAIVRSKDPKIGLESSKTKKVQTITNGCTTVNLKY